MSIKPEDALPDGQNFIEIDNIRIRKGSFAALLANADIISADTSSTEEKTEARITFAEIISTVVVSGVHKHIVWKNPDLQQLMQDAAANKSVG